MPLRLRLLAALLLLVEFASTGQSRADTKPRAPMLVNPSLTLQNILVPSRWQLSEGTNTLEFRPLVPFKLWDQLNLMRIAIPFRTRFDTGSGLGLVRFFDLVLIAEDWGVWGVGPVLSLEARETGHLDTSQVGPVGGVLATHSGLTYGVLAQNLFSERVTGSTLQPIAVYQPAARWTVGLGELPFIFDWRTHRFVFAPIGFQLGYRASIFEQSCRFYINPQYNTQNIAGASRWNLVFGFTLLSSAAQSPFVERGTLQ